MSKLILSFSKVGLIATLIMLLSACDIQLHSELTEQEANEMVSVLMMHGIAAKKSPGKKGLVNLVVPEKQFSLAVEILKSNGYPKTRYQDLCSVFSKEGMISSPLEEKARYVCAKSQEISQTLDDIDGVITARVHLVLPESDKMGEEMQPASASVYIKYRRDINMEKNVPQIKYLVKNSIESLSFEKITVALFPAEDMMAQLSSSTSNMIQPTSTASKNEFAVPKAFLFVLIIVLVLLLMICLYLFMNSSKLSKKAKSNSRAVATRSNNSSLRRAS